MTALSADPWPDRDPEHSEAPMTLADECRQLHRDHLARVLALPDGGAYNEPVEDDGGER